MLWRGRGRCKIKLRVISDEEDGVTVNLYEM